MIPLKLKKEGFRFIKVKKNKAPMELDWTNKNNYSANDKTLIEFIKLEKRYGIVTGYNNLLVIDFDNEKVQQDVFRKLPPTFTVKSAGKGLLHLYYFVDDPKSTKVLDVNKDVLADIQGRGKQIIGPNSEMDNGRKYEIVDDLEIATTTFAVIEKAFERWLNIEKSLVEAKQNQPDDCEAIKRNITVDKVLRDYNINTSKNPTECPFHSSKGGRCFSFNDNVWHCFHCEEKGNVFHLVMKLDKLTFVAAKKKLAERAGIKLNIQQPSDGLIKIDNYLDNAKHFYELQPYFYDKQEMFWFWMGDRWEMVDDVEICRTLDSKLGFMGQTVSSGLRRNHLEAMKWYGREKQPKPAKKHWIQFKNKAYSLTSGNIYTVTPDYFFTNPIPWSIGENEETPTMDKLFGEWVGDEFKDTLYEIIAYCCYNKYPIHLLFCLVGSGNNGKSRFVAMIENFIGKENICSTELDILLDSRFESFKLYKKLVCTMGETNFGIISKTSLLKKLTGQDLIGFEYKNKRPFDDYNYAKIIICSNSLPTSTDTSDGFYRRWMIVDFPNTFPEGKDILKTIPEVEYNNLAKKVTSILPKLLKFGAFSKQGTIKERKDKYILSSNPLPLFINKCCTKGDDEFMTYNELYGAYIKFLRKLRKRKVSRKEFKAALEDEGLFIEKTAKNTGNFDEQSWKSAYWVEGVKLNEGLDNLDFFTTSPTHQNILRERVEIVTKKSKLSKENTENDQKTPKNTENDVFLEISLENQDVGKCGYCGRISMLKYKNNEGNYFCEGCK